MRTPIHVDEIAEIYVRVVMKDKPDHAIYNTGGHTISLGDLADIVYGVSCHTIAAPLLRSGGKEAIESLAPLLRE